MPAGLSKVHGRKQGRTPPGRAALAVSLGLLISGLLPLGAQEAPPANRLPLLAILPEPLPDGSTSLALEASSFFLRPERQRSADGRSLVHLDGEEWQLVARGSMPLGPGRLAATLRLAHRSAGIGDRAIQGWHRLLGTPGGGREQLPEGRLDLHVARDGAVVAHLDRNGLHLLDLDLAWIQDWGSAASGGRWGVALQAPTGRRADLSGSGSWDGLVSMALWRSWGPWRLHGQAERGWMVLGKDNPWRKVMDRRGFTRAWAGGGWKGEGQGLLSGLGLDLCLAWMESPYGTGLPRVDRSALQQHWTLSHRALPRWSFRVTEEAGSYVSPDISLALEYRVPLGR